MELSMDGQTLAFGDAGQSCKYQHVPARPQLPDNMQNGLALLCQIQVVIQALNDILLCVCGFCTLHHEAQGIWTGSYGPHGLEILELRCSVTPADVPPGCPFTGQRLQALKLIGDPNVPALK
jgi:hypothetical protein